MPEPIDQTDETPEWEKRMFRNLRMTRAGIVVILFVIGLPIMCGYQIY